MQDLDNTVQCLDTNIKRLSLLIREKSGYNFDNFISHPVIQNWAISLSISLAMVCVGLEMTYTAPLLQPLHHTGSLCDNPLPLTENLHHPSYLFPLLFWIDKHTSVNTKPIVSFQPVVKAKMRDYGLAPVGLHIPSSLFGITNTEGWQKLQSNNIHLRWGISALPPAWVTVHVSLIRTALLGPTNQGPPSNDQTGQNINRN